MLFILNFFAPAPLALWPAPLAFCAFFSGPLASFS